MRFLRLSNELIMKKLLLLPILLLSLISTSCWGVDWNDLVERDGLYYQKFTDTPFTGKYSGPYGSGEIKDGQMEGAWEEYWGDGLLRGKGSYKNGVRVGDWVNYLSNGQLYSKGSTKNGKWEGEVVWYNESGSIKEVRTFKDRKLISN